MNNQVEKKPNIASAIYCLIGLVVTVIAIYLLVSSKKALNVKFYYEGEVVGRSYLEAKWLVKGYEGYLDNPSPGAIGALVYLGILAFSLFVGMFTNLMGNKSNSGIGGLMFFLSLIAGLLIIFSGYLFAITNSDFKEYLKESFKNEAYIYMFPAKKYGIAIALNNLAAILYLTACNSGKKPAVVKATATTNAQNNNFNYQNNQYTKAPLNQGGIQCKRCNSMNQAGALFCFKCGNDLKFVEVASKKCQMCGASNPENSKFCNSCGKEMNQSENMISCPKCGYKNKEGSKFCNSCGNKIESNNNGCSNCGFVNMPGTKFCSNCGNNLVKAEAKEEKAEETVINEFLCPNCNSTLAEGTKFCPECGSTISWSTEEVVEEVLEEVSEETEE